MTLQDIINAYATKRTNYNETKRKLEEKIARLNKKLTKNEKNYPYSIQDILEPLAREIKSRCGFKAFEIYGPFGLENETSIYFANEGVDGDIKICEVETWGLTVRPQYGDNGVDGYTYWNGETTNKFAPGTIGELNGYNQVFVELPMDIDEIIKVLRHSVK